MKKFQLISLPAVTALAGIALTGCVSVGQHDPDEGANSSGQASGASVEVTGDNSVGGENAAAPSAGQTQEQAGAEQTTGEGQTQALPLEPGYSPAATSRLSCESGSVEISAAEEVVELTAPCDRVTISAADAIVLAPYGIGELAITGADVDVAASSVDKVTLVGSDNTVAYQGDAPAISDTGVDNTVSSAPLSE